MRRESETRGAAPGRTACSVCCEAASGRSHGDARAAHLRAAKSAAAHGSPEARAPAGLEGPVRPAPARALPLPLRRAAAAEGPRRRAAPPPRALPAPRLVVFSVQRGRHFLSPRLQNASSWASREKSRHGGGGTWQQTRWKGWKLSCVSRLRCTGVDLEVLVGKESK